MPGKVQGTKHMPMSWNKTVHQDDDPQDTNSVCDSNTVCSITIRMPSNILVLKIVS